MTSKKYIEYGSPILLDEAKSVVAAAEKEAELQDIAPIIAVVDSAAQLVVLHRLDHAQFGSIDVAISKAASAVKFKNSTKVFEDAFAQGGKHLRLLGISDLTAIGGGIPLLRNGKIIGAIGVAGTSPEQDILVAEAGASVINENSNG